MNSEIIAALARHILTGIAGAAAVKYSIDTDAVNAIVSGLSAAVGVAWSILDKRKQKAPGGAGA